MFAVDDAGLEELVGFLKRTRGFDLGVYKRTSLFRRLGKRMRQLGVTNVAEYLDYLEVHPDEFHRLFDTILINVTSFFRDAAAWRFLSQEIIPRIVTAKGDERPIRVWSAGCSTGQEAYSLAIVLAEALGVPNCLERVKIYATDVDDEALARARLATYEDEQLADVPEDLRGKYFDRSGDHYSFRPDLRRIVIFGRHDIAQDAPISRLDLLVCRNTLMYFNAEAQSRILARFHFALNDTGFLFMGKAEMLLTHADLFTPMDLRYRIFVRVPRVEPRDRAALAAHLGNGEYQNQGVLGRLRELAFNATPLAQMVVDRNRRVVLANHRLRALFGLDPRDIGRPLHDLELSYRPVELRSLIERAEVAGHPIAVTGIERRLAGGESQYFDVQLVPLRDADAASLGTCVVFIDTTTSYHLQQRLHRANQDLATAYEELQSANEEMETTNEELQSANEELETTNEELQSTNEEIETMNEELQSTNEELQTTNDELRQRTLEITNLNSFLQSILASLRAGVAVVDKQLRVLLWNHRATDLWGLTADEVRGRSLLELDIGLPVERIPINAFLVGKASYHEDSLEAVNRRGRAIRCAITITPYLGEAGERLGVVLMMEEAPTDGGAQRAG